MSFRKVDGHLVMTANGSLYPAIGIIPGAALLLVDGKKKRLPLDKVARWIETGLADGFSEADYTRLGSTPQGMQYRRLSDGEIITLPPGNPHPPYKVGDRIAFCKGQRSDGMAYEIVSIKAGGIQVKLPREPNSLGGKVIPALWPLSHVAGLAE